MRSTITDSSNMPERILRILGRAVVAAVLAAACFAGTASAASNPACTHADDDRLGGWTGYARYCFPIVALPASQSLNYGRLAERGLNATVRWRHRHWYCEFLHCTHGPYPYATAWGTVPLFETVDGLATAQPSARHLAALDRVAASFEKFWDPRRGGYAPYPYDSGAGVRAFFDDNGWIGLAYYNAYEATKNPRWLRDAQRAARFVRAQGWDEGSGGIWWESWHRFKSGPALASNSLLAILLYNVDHEPWQLEAAEKYVDWGNTVDNSDERRWYRNNPDGGMTLDMVQAPMVYAQYLLCQDGLGEEYCERAGRIATTLSEQIYDANGYVYNYAPQYDAIFLQWMMAYGQATGVGYWLHLAEVNGQEAARHAADRSGMYLKSWWGKPFGGLKLGGLIRTDTATASLFAWLDVYSG